jgi:C_GCAxxG_C_C family probable redox protein
MAKKISCGFGAGIGRTAGMCGAVAGAIMVLGLKYGMADSANLEEKQITYEKVREYISRFGEKNGSIHCADLLECDISTPEGFEKAKEEDLMVTVCEDLVVDAARILEEML